MTNWSPGFKLGPYELIALIGAGGMGEVWRARDTRLGRTVAIKRLTGQYLDRFEQEARLISRLNHPNICQIYDVGPSYLVLEHVEGQPLRGPLPVDEAIRLAVQIASALDEAHRHGILHRDLKPANILVTGSGVPKLLDFGLAKLMQAEEADVTQTAEGTVLGTVAYMSPEQAQGNVLDARFDIFSFGAILYELLSGNRAFGGSTTVQILTAVMHTDPRPLITNAELERVVKRCLRKRPQDRFQRAAELRSALEQIRTTSASFEPSIAVLPFTNLSADKENEYFSDGLAEEIINALTQIPGLKVTARTSAFAFRGKEQDVRTIAEALDVQTILEGSVRRAGNRIRVSAQLINAANGYHLWSERYDRELADVFAVQDDIAASIAKALQVKLGAGPSVRRYTPSFPGYEAYLKAVHEAQKLTLEGMRRSKEWYDQAISLDPDFALAHSSFGVHFAQLANYGLLPAHEAMPLVRKEARTALEIDPSLAHGHAVLGLVAGLYDYDWAEAARRFELALAVDPVPSEVRRYYALYYLLPVDRAEEAADECARAFQEDPLNLLGRVRFAQCLQAAGRESDASRELTRVLELDEDLWFTHFILGLTQLRQGQLNEAASHADRASALAPWNPSATGLLAAVCRIRGDDERSEELLQTLKAGLTYGTPLALATFHIACSEIDAAADWTEKAIAERHPAVFFFLRAHAQALRHSARWPGLARMLNL